MTAGETDRGPTPLVVRGLTDVRSVREMLWPAFEAAEGALPTLEYRQEVDMARLRREVVELTTEDRPDVLLVADPLAFDREGLIEPVAAIDPGPRPAAWVDAGERWVSIYAQPIVAIYNARSDRCPCF